MSPEFYESIERNTQERQLAKQQQLEARQRVQDQAMDLAGVDPLSEQGRKTIAEITGQPRTGGYGSKVQKAFEELPTLLARNQAGMASYRGAIDRSAFELGDETGFGARQANVFRNANQRFANEFAGDQRGFLNTLQQQMAGQGPSLAQSQFASALEQGIATQQAQAATGGFDPMARRVAAQNIGTLAQGAARGSAEIRAQEQLAAQQQFAAALAQAQGDQLQRQQMTENLRLQYEQMGLNREQAQFAARQQVEQMALDALMGKQSQPKGPGKFDRAMQIAGIVGQVGGQVGAAVAGKPPA